MHRSKLAGFIIDCQTSEVELAASFWSEALGMPQATVAPAAAATRYRQLRAERLDLNIEVQAVEHPSRVHLDIETDDIEAEVRRLEALGARRIAAVHTWIVMEAPTGQRFCVVRAQSAHFLERATQWP
jgi:Glyoxalase-like domain